MGETDRPESPVTMDQEDVIAFLGAPETHGLAAPLPRFDTHGAIVFLAGDTAFKMKRAVRFPFMDFSTLERRRAACERELEVNAGNAPNLYQSVVPICRSARGLALGGPGEPVEWVVRMARFDETRTLDRVAAQGALPDSLLAALVDAVRASHERAPRSKSDGSSSLARYLGQNEEAFRGFPDLFAPEEVAQLAEAARTALAAVTPLLRDRAARGLVRRCHGDLHLGNIVLHEGRPVLFDAIEFDEDIATCDLFYDLAFLVMDLWHRGQSHAASRVLSRYCWTCPDAELDGLAALPLFVSIRAALRAKIEAAEAGLAGSDAAARHRTEAGRYFALARAALAPRPRRLVAVGGLSGTGKSTLAAGIAPRLGPPPGAVHWRSDVERKRLLGAAETERLPRETYTQEASDAVYRRLLGRAALTLAAGCPAIVDAVFARETERQAVAAVAASAGAGFAGLWLEAPGETLRERVSGRRDDASDADLAVIAGQARYDVGPVSWPRVDASGAAQAVLDHASRRLGLEPAGGT
jgi:uncharacterized protein